MRLTRRGRVVALITLLTAVFVVAFATGSYGIDYYSPGCPCIVQIGE